MNHYFTLEQANHALTLVNAIVHDILQKVAESETIQQQVKTERSQKEVSETVLLERLRRAEKLLNGVDYHMKELESVGVYLKDLKLGLVDFPCLYEGRMVYLCWQLGEKKILSWHELNHGFNERKPIDESFRSINQTIV